MFVMECRGRDIDIDIDIDRTYIQTKRKLTVSSITAEPDVLWSESHVPCTFQRWYPRTSPSLTPSPSPHT